MVSFTFWLSDNLRYSVDNVGLFSLPVKQQGMFPDFVCCSDENIIIFFLLVYG